MLNFRENFNPRNPIEVEASKYRGAEEFIKSKNPREPRDKKYLYRGLEQRFNPRHDLTTTDAPRGYSTWTDNPLLAREYAGDNGFVYRIELPRSLEGTELVDEDGERALFVDNEKSAGLRGVTGKEYLVYVDHDDYSHDLITEYYTDEQLITIWNQVHERKEVRTMRKMITPIEEGIQDKNLFKCVFMAGGGGSGKGYIASRMFGYGDTGAQISPMGVKVINSDTFFEKFLKREGLPMVISLADKDIYDQQARQRALAKKKTNMLQHQYMNGMLPLIIDGTGRDLHRILQTKRELENFGYDTTMIFVNTSLEVALERNAKRARTVDPQIITDMWYEIQQNMGVFQKEFGNENFYVIDASKSLEGKELEDFTLQLFKMGDRILTKPLKNRTGRRILDDLRAIGGRYISDLYAYVMEDR